jgi:hypothetical protein
METDARYVQASETILVDGRPTLVEDAFDTGAGPVVLVVEGGRRLVLPRTARVVVVP